MNMSMLIKLTLTLIGLGSIAVMTESLSDQEIVMASQYGLDIDGFEDGLNVKTLGRFRRSSPKEDHLKDIKADEQLYSFYKSEYEREKERLKKKSNQNDNNDEGHSNKRPRVRLSYYDN